MSIVGQRHSGHDGRVVETRRVVPKDVGEQLRQSLQLQVVDQDVAKDRIRDSDPRTAPPKPLKAMRSFLSLGVA